MLIGPMTCFENESQGICLRFYMVTGEKGWLPYGTDCSGEEKREAYCVKVRVQVFFWTGV